jgi:tetratricopeptide (TPR) repeat protein
MNRPLGTRAPTDTHDDGVDAPEPAEAAVPPHRPKAARGHARPGRRRSKLVLAAGGATVVLIAAGAFGVVRSNDSGPGSAARPSTAVPAVVTGRGTAASLDELIVDLQDRLDAVPRDHVSWATLGLAYVQQARVTVDPSYYALADGALERSLEIDTVANFLAHAGLSALASARHDFAEAKTHAERGLEINSFSPILHGALSDAELQLGNYDAAFDAVQRMVDLSPDTSSLTRASYTWELRGNLERATQLMQRALDDAPTPADRAFAQFQLGELAFNAGDPEAALDLYNAALAASPDDAAALAGKARALAALGQTESAIDTYAALVVRAPEPTYLLEYGELLESAGRTSDAEAQYGVFMVTQQLFAASGVKPDAVVALFHADHGDPVAALVAAEGALRDNPFLSVHDAHAWALHRNGRDEEALAAIDRALELGYRNARFHFHAGMISHALGDEERTRRELTTALEINPHFNPLEVDVAEATLASIGAAT